MWCGGAATRVRCGHVFIYSISRDIELLLVPLRGRAIGASDACMVVGWEHFIEASHG
jgi:hypothetical protein